MGESPLVVSVRARAVYGPKNDGTYIIEFKTAAGEALAISVPAVHWPSLAQARSNTSTLRRLARLSESQAREVALRVQKFKPDIAPAWELDAVEALLKIWDLRHG